MCTSPHELGGNPSSLLVAHCWNCDGRRLGSGRTEGGHPLPRHHPLVPALFRILGRDEFRVENDLTLANVIAYELDGVGEFRHADEIRRAVGERGTAVIEVDSYSLRMVLRALDHAKARGLLDEDGNRLRDDLVTRLVPSPAYELVDAEGTKIRDWHSTSGPYVQGERLVTGPDDRWLVVKGRQPLLDETGVLVVEPFPAERGL